MNLLSSIGLINSVLCCIGPDITANVTSLASGLDWIFLQWIPSIIECQRYVTEFTIQFNGTAVGGQTVTVDSDSTCFNKTADGVISYETNNRCQPIIIHPCCNYSIEITFQLSRFYFKHNFTSVPSFNSTDSKTGTAT